MKMLLYCTKDKKKFLQVHPFDLSNSTFRLSDDPFNCLNGKIVGECDYEVEKIESRYIEHKYNELKEICKKSCLSTYALMNYARKDKFCFELSFYAIHIENLVIYDKPKELSEYYSYIGFKGDINNYHFIEKAPQNMMYAYELHSELGYSGTYNRWFEKKILISIRPQWLCKILNGEKTIEVRKKVLKEMM